MHCFPQTISSDRFSFFFFKIMAFPVDMLNGYTHEDLESSAEDYLSELRCGDPNQPEFLSLSDHSKVRMSK